MLNCKACKPVFCSSRAVFYEAVAEVPSGILIPKEVAVSTLAQSNVCFCYSSETPGRAGMAFQPWQKIIKASSL